MNEKSQRRKISCYCPLKVFLNSMMPFFYLLLKQHKKKQKIRSHITNRRTLGSVNPATVKMQNISFFSLSLLYLALASAAQEKGSKI
jgi:hypothetical protein